MSELARVAFFLSLLPFLQIPGLFEFVPLLSLPFSPSLGNHDEMTVTISWIQNLGAPAGAILGTVALCKIVTRKKAIRGFGLASWAVFLGTTSLILWWTDFYNLLYSLPAWKSFLRGHLRNKSEPMQLKSFSLSGSIISSSASLRLFLSVET